MIRFYKRNMHMKKAENLKEMIPVFDPFPLNESNFDDFYINTYAARGNNPIEKIKLSLENSINPQVKILFMGHRGSGKSSELYLLKKEIGSEYDVINFYIQDEIEPTGMKYTDFIFAIMSQIIQYVERTPSLQVESSEIDELYNYWNQEQIITVTDIDSTEVNAGISAKLKFLGRIAVQGSGIFKTGATTKVETREKIEPKIGYLIQLLNNLIVKINEQLPNKGLLLIVEDLDKLDISEAEELFVYHRKTILSLNIRMILTFPIYLVYNRQYNMIKEDFDYWQLLNMIKVKDKYHVPYETGINTLKNIIEKRTELSLIEPSALNFAIMKSGGAIRDLFQMIRDSVFEALTNDHTIIRYSDMQESYGHLKAEYERLIHTEEDIEKLSEIYADPKPALTDDVLMSLLLRGLVLEYNGERWCGLHPAVEDFLIEKGVITAGEEDA